MSRVIVAILAAFALAHTPARADDAAALLHSFEGEWRAEGVAFGAGSQTTMIWEPALGGKFQRLDYRIEMTRSTGPSTFEGVGYYQLGDGETLKAFWSDNSGDLHPINAGRDGNALISHWGVEGGKQGRTRYELLPSGQMQVTDWIKTPEGWRQFNQADFRRSEN